MVRIIAISFLFVLLCISSANATCGRTKTAIFFANGMFNDRAGATNSLLYLWGAYSIKYPDQKIDLFELAYNTNESLLEQLFQVYRQKAKDSGINFWRSFELIFSKMNSDEYKEFLRRSLLAEKNADRDLRSQIHRYRTLIDDDFNIITVAHSQGNLYTLFSFEDLSSDATKMISVATPATAVYQSGPYFTFKSDGVIKYIPTALPPNFEKINVGNFDHEFLGHYMADPVAQDVILNRLDDFIKKIPASGPRSLIPGDAYFNSDMTNTLEWFDRYLNSKRKLSVGECIVVESLFSIFALHGRTCEERDFDTLSVKVSECAKIDDGEAGPTACPYYRGMDFMNPYKAFYPHEHWEHYSLNPLCEFTYEEFTKVRMQGTEEALKIINLHKNKTKE